MAFKFFDIPKKENLFEAIGILKQKFMSLFQQEKKVKAIETFTEGAPFPHRNYLNLIKECLNDGFLEDKEAGFLDHMLTKYEINYLDWSHRTKWIKQQIASRKAERPKQIQATFAFEARPPQVAIPTHLIAKPQASQRARV